MSEESPRGPLERIVIWLHCKLAGHQYRVLRRMNQGARKVGCDRCGKAWGCTTPPGHSCSGIQTSK